MSREKRIVEEGYDEIAEEYAEARRRMGRRDKKYLGLLLERLPEGSRVLDLGCGSGVPIAKLLVEHCRVTGVDISRRQIQLARGPVPEANFLVGDMTEISFPDEAFDSFHVRVRSSLQRNVGGSAPSTSRMKTVQLPLLPS